MTTLPSSSSSETRISARARVAVVAVVGVVPAGMTKYRPIVRRTAAFAAPPIPPPTNAPGGETVIRWLGIGDCFLYYIPQQKKKWKRKNQLNVLEGHGHGGKGKVEKEGEGVEWSGGGNIVGQWKVHFGWRGKRNGETAEWR
jgi:hypothetical protein